MVSVWGELKRRNVVKVAVAYAVVGWLLVEIAATVFPVFQMPEWTVVFVTMLIILGFPVALILSWAYELTPDGVKRSHEVEPSESITHVTGRKIDFAIIGALVLALGFVTYEYVLDDGEGGAGVLPNSVAVLPLENLSPDPDDAYFAAGIHEEILNHLAKLRNLNVISRTSVVRYADSDLSIPEIADELNVETVIEGSVRYANDRVLVTIQLIDPETDAHLWSESYNRDLSDVFGIQADIAMNVANSLEAEFSTQEQENLERVPTNSPEAYRLFLNAKSVVQLGLQGFSDVPSARRLAIQSYLDQALALDPEFALARVWKAIVYQMSMYEPVGSEEAWLDRRAELDQLIIQNAEAALELDPSLGLAHAVLAFLHLSNGRGAQAVSEIEIALRLDPNDPDVLDTASYIELWRGRSTEAVRFAARRVELDPNNAEAHQALAFALFSDERPADSLESFETCLALDPLDPGCVRGVVGNQLILGRYDEARAALATLLRQGAAVNAAFAAYLFALAGQSDNARSAFENVMARSDDQYVDPVTWAFAYLGIGDYDEALRQLEAAVQNPESVQLGPIVRTLQSLASLDPRLGEPAFQEVLTRLVPR